MKNNSITFLQLSSLHKVFLDEDYSSLQELGGLTALKGERVSWQILHTCEGTKDWPAGKRTVKFTVNADKKIQLLFRNVGNVPSALPCSRYVIDEDYLRTAPGLFPDVLEPLEQQEIDVFRGNCHSLFVTATIPEDMEAGIYPIELTFDYEGEMIKKTFILKVMDAALPKQNLIYTQWFHADCIASYYNLEVFSEAHWELIEKFIKMAVHTGINMLLTPLFTLPLDTQVGAERPTLQLVDVYYTKDQGYRFGFEKLKRWISICQKCGIEYYEMSHLFSQWNTGFTPKIVAKTENGQEKIFGWHTKALTEEYRNFVHCLLPELIKFLKKEGIYENTYFHVSDEPAWENGGELYKAERKMLEGLIPEEKIMDAMSHYEFYEQGLTKKPIVKIDCIDSFVEKKCDNLWAYYCWEPCSDGYTNRFMAMPSRRTRIIGFVMYRYGIQGFLHWGYNFYYSALSQRKINPYMITDADENFMSGDAFSVYPGKEEPLESLRTVAFYEGLQDYRLCQLLEVYIGREAVLRILSEAGVESFCKFPRTDQDVFAIRSRMLKKLETVLNKTL